MIVEVLTRRKCSSCNGTGKVVPESVIAFRQKWSDAPPRRLVSEFYLEYGYDPREDVKVECLHCNGTGYIQEWREVEL